MAEFVWSRRPPIKTKSGVSLNAEVGAGVVGKTIEQIQRSNNGKCTPEQLVEKSRSPRAKTHKLFEWDDSVAAEQYRCEQAQLIIRCVDIVCQDDEGESYSVRAFSSVTSDQADENRVYVSTLDAMSDPVRRDEVLSEALSSLRQWRRKWARLNKLAECVAVLNQVDDAIDELRGVVATEK